MYVSCKQYGHVIGGLYPMARAMEIIDWLTAVER